jgi:hypothetical protein
MTPLGLGFSRMPQFDSTELFDYMMEFLDFSRNFSQVRPLLRIHHQDISIPEFRLFFDITIIGFPIL